VWLQYSHALIVLIRVDPDQSVKEADESNNLIVLLVSKYCATF